MGPEPDAGHLVSSAGSKAVLTPAAEGETVLNAEKGIIPIAGLVVDTLVAVEDADDIAKAEGNEGADDAKDQDADEFAVIDEGVLLGYLHD
jgi:hypothetical protein